MLPIADVTARAWDMTLSEPFGIAGGAQELARNVLVTVTLEDGTTGIGEAAPFPAVTGETQALVQDALGAVRGRLLGQDARRWALIARELAELREVPSARCALETALLDALCRRSRLSLWTLFGGVDAVLTSDITIPTGSAAAAADAARRATARGFTTLKLKVGGSDVGLDLARLESIVRAAPGARLILDANASLSADQALELVQRSRRFGARLVLFEQPCAAVDYAGLRAVREHGRLPVAADESARSCADVVRCAAERAVDVVNLKIMKSGVGEALAMALTARSLGLELMIGGMVESKLAMSVSACLAAGLGGFSFVDLDTPWFMVGSPAAGGYVEDGPVLAVCDIEAGHGVAVHPR